MESLGARFKRERERQKMTLDDVATATKIGTRMLTALEGNHFDQLPGGIFNKGFVRAYARHLGMDEEQAISDYLAATNATQPLREPETVLTALAVRAEESRAVERPRGDGLPWDKLAAVLLLVSFAFAVWGWRTRKPNHTVVNQPAVAAAASVPAPEVSAPPTPAAQPAAPNPSDVPASLAATQPPSSLPATTAPAPASTEVQPPAPAASGTLLLLIQARNASWVEVSADGKFIAHEMLAAGTQKTIEAQREIVVKAGNIGGLDFTFNGKKLPPQGSPDEVKTLKFDPTGLQAPAPATHSPNPA